MLMERRTVESTPCPQATATDPAYTMGPAAGILNTAQGLLRAIDGARLISPLRAAAGYRRYVRSQQHTAARARELINQSAPTEAACRIVILHEAQRINARPAQTRDPRIRGFTSRVQRRKQPSSPLFSPRPVQPARGRAAVPTAVARYVTGTRSAPG